eukprot:1123136-Prorocentrum_minimum.AAC.1
MEKFEGRLLLRVRAPLRARPAPSRKHDVRRHHTATSRRASGCEHHVRRHNTATSRRASGCEHH